jgi:hypothetical protein
MHGSLGARRANDSELDQRLTPFILFSIKPDVK